MSRGGSSVILVAALLLSASPVLHMVHPDQGPPAKAADDTAPSSGGGPASEGSVADGRPTLGGPEGRPLVFWEENLGQWPHDAPWVLRGGHAGLTRQGLELYGPTGVVRLGFQTGPGGPVEVAEARGTTSVFTMEDSFVGAQQAARLRVPDAWPGIDFEVYTTPYGQLEFDLAVAPGADPGLARLQIEGAAPHLDGGRLALGPFTFEAPRSFQSTGPVDSAFVLDGTRVGFWVGDYDPRLPLVIDPVLTYGTILATQTSTSSEIIYDSDSDGDSIYFVGTLDDADDYEHTTQDFSTANPSSSVSTFLARLNAASHQLESLVVVQGTLSSIAQGMALRDDGSVFIAGYSSGNMPVANAPFATRQGTDGFVLRLDPSGPTDYDLGFLTYIGGTRADWAHSVHLNPDGTFWVGGNIEGFDGFPTAPDGGVHPASASTRYNVYVTRWQDGEPPVLLTSTIFGSADIDYVYHNSFDIDEKGNIYVAGATDCCSSPFLPTTPDAIEPSPLGNDDHFYAKVDAQGNIDHLSYWGSPNLDYHSMTTVIKVVREDEIVIAGNTERCCVHLTSPRPFDANLGTGTTDDAYVSHIDIANGTVLFSTHLGQKGNDYARAVDYDRANGVYYVAGYNQGGPLEPDLPVPYGAGKPGHNGGTDAFVTAIDPRRVDPSLPPTEQVHMVAWTMYLGSASSSWLYDMTFAQDGALHASGYTGGGFADVPPVTPDAIATSKRTASNFDPFFQRYDVGGRLTLQAEGGGITKKSPATAFSTFAGTEVKVTATAVGMEWPVGPADMRWDVDGDGLFMDGIGEGPFFFTEPQEATRPVCVEVPDPGAFAPPMRRCMEIVWKNKPPTAALVVLTPPDGIVASLPRYYRGQDIWLDGSDSHDQEGTLLYDEVEWTVTPAPDVFGGAKSLVARAVFEDVGVKTVVLEVTDGSGDSDAASVQFVVTGRAPTVSCALGATRVARWVDVDVTAGDPDGHLASWVFAPGLGLGNVSGVGAPPGHLRTSDRFPADAVGVTGVAVLTVTDNDGETATCEMPYTVGAAALTADYTAVRAGEAVRFSDASRAMPGRAVIGWQWSIDGALVSDEPSFEAHLAPGSYRVRIVVTDGAATDAYEGVLVVGAASAGPKAVIELSPGPYTADMPVQFRDASVSGAAALQSRSWTFRDGTSTEERPIRYMGEGHHVVRLRVEDTMGRSSEAEQYLFVAAADRIVPSFSASTVTPYVGQQVLFLDGSRTAGFGITDRRWDFGDGSAAEQGISARHVFQEGEYVVTLTLVDAGGAHHSVSHVVRVRPAPLDAVLEPYRPGPPVADAGPDRVAAPGSVVRLEAAGAKQDASWQWEQVGGPRTVMMDADTPRPSMAVPYVEGELVFRLTVTSVWGTATDTVRITIGEADDGFGTVPPPDARFTADRAALHVRLVAPELGSGASYAWDLGDGRTAHGRTVAHTYDEQGAYQVQLLVRDPHGRESFHYEVLDLRPDVTAAMQHVEARPGSVLGVSEGTMYGVGAILVVLAMPIVFFVHQQRKKP